MKSKCWFLLIAAAFLAMASTSPGQRGSNWRVYKAADGLPETLTTSVTVAPHGHLWVRHPNVEWAGWLDGYEVKAIPAPGLGNSRIYESLSGQIWTFTSEGLQQYQSQASGWIHYAVPEVSASIRKNGLSAFWPVPLCPLKQNHVLMLVPDGLLECNLDQPSHPQTSVVRAASETGLQKFSGLTPARDGGLWIAGAKGLVKLLGPIRNLKPEMEWQEHLLGDALQIRNLREPVEDDNGGVTMLAESLKDHKTVVAHFDGQQWSVESGLGEKITQAWRGADKSFWTASFYSLSQFKAGEKLPGADEESSPHRYFDFATETNGVFWLATSDGLMRYAPLTWRSPPGAEESNSFIHSIAEDHAGRLWATSAKALYSWHDDVWTNYALPPELADKAENAPTLFTLASNIFVTATGDRLLQFNPKTGQFSEVINGQRTRIKPLGRLKDGTLCIQSPGSDSGSQPAALELFDGTSFSPFPYPQPDSNMLSGIRFLFASQNDSLWLSGTNGIAWYHNKKWQNFPAATQIVSEAPACLIEVSNGKLWCGVQDKILEFDGKTWNIVGAGFYHVNALFKGHDGSIWVASDNGLHRFQHGTLTANSVEEGLPSAAVSAVYEDTYGHIWAGTARGLSLYHPEADPDPPQTFVQNLPGPNNTVREGAVVTISFNGQDKWKYTPADRLLYSYQLDGQEWSPYQEQRSASFLDLSPGKHSFHVRSMDRNWNVDPKPAVLAFTVTLPWYREARLLLISATGLAITIFFAGLAFNRHRQLVRSYAEVEAKVALRTKQLELANQELFHSQKMNALGTLAAGIAHDFNNILSIIKGSAQIIEDNLENEDKIRTRTDRIKTVVEQGAGIVQAMLGFSRASDRQFVLCDLNAVAQETITLLGDRFLREVQVQFTPAPAALPQVPASKDFIQQILLNLIFNAAEAATERRQIVLSIGQTNQLPPIMALKPATAAAYVSISVKDFGSGIAPEIMPRIFEPFFTTKSLSVRRGTGLGLSMVYELARQMDCGLSVESILGQGSVFTLIIPVRDLPADSMNKNQ